MTLAGLSLFAIAAEVVVYFDFAVNRGFGARVVAEIAWLRAVPVVGQCVPYATLLGAVIALARIKSDREVLVIEASGISPLRIVAPVALFSAGLMLAALAISAWAEPRLNQRLAERIAASVQRSPGTPIRSGVVTQIGAWRIVASEVSSRGDSLRGVAIWVPSLGNTVFARASTLHTTPGGEKEIELEDGSLLVNREEGPYHVAFARSRTALAAGGVEQDGRAASLARHTLGELERASRAESDPEAKRLFEIEWHRRFAPAAATLVLGVLGAAIALRARRLSRSAGAVAAIATAIGYVALLQLGNALAGSPDVPAAAAVWLPNLALAAEAAALLALPAPLELLGLARRRSATAEAQPRPPRPHRFVLTRYLLARFALMAALCFGALFVALVLVDVVDNLQWFTKYRSTLDEVMRFYAARLPLLAARTVPIALVLAASLTVSGFGVTGELMGMRACGISSVRIALPILIPCALVALGYRAAVDRIVPQAAARATQIKRVEIKAQRTERLSLWLRDRDHLIQADRIDPLAGVAQGLTVYELDAAGLPTSRTDAEAARQVGEGIWQLTAPRRIELGPDGARVAVADPLVRLGDELEAKREGAQLSIAELRDEIDTLEQRGFDTTAHRVDLQAKLAAPLACVVLPALAVLLATGGPPFRTPAQVVLISVALVLGHLVLTALAAALGYRGSLSAWAGGWGAMAVFGAALGLLVTDRIRRSQWLSASQRE